MTIKLLTKQNPKPLLVTLILFAFCLSSFSQTETYFVTTWKTDNPGSSNSTSITIPTTGVGYNYSVDWTYDGVTFNAESTGVMGNITHDYGAPGTHTVAISGTFPRIYFNCANGDEEKLMSIEQWGTNTWTSMESAFACCYNLVYNATDIPDLSLVLDTSYMFYYTGFNGDINNWDVSTVENMTHMFDDTRFFNQNLNSWNVSNVINMRGMFAYSVFNGNISSWNVSNVENMSNMFLQNYTFNGNISSWVTSSVLYMNDMFSYCNFNGDISGWDVSNVTDMGYMFQNNPMFNQDISGWDVSKVEYFNTMFYEATAFDQNLGSWDISSASDLSEMFLGATLSTTNYDNLLIGWSTLSAGETNIPTFMDFDAGNSTYCNGESARNLLDTNYNWNIYDAGLDCSGLGLEDRNYNMSLELYPNPSNSRLHIKSNNHLKRITLSDINGKINGYS